MNLNIQKTKKKLTIIFSIVIFFVIFISSFIFFSAKYIWETRIEKINLTLLSESILKKEIQVQDFILSQNSIPENISRSEENKRPFSKKNLWENSEVQHRGFINYILIDSEEKILSSNIKDTISNDLIFSIYENNSYLEISEKSWFLIKKIPVATGQLIFMKELRYNFSDYISDIAWFLFMDILFLFLLYFIVFQFLQRTFLPVEENMKDMKNFIHNAGHELKTPISVIDSNLQIMDDLKLYNADLSKELKKEILRLNSIIEGLITLSDINSLRDMEKNNVQESIQEIIEEFKFKISEKKLHIKIDIPKTVTVLSNKNYFHIFLSNIIGNAIKYNKDSGEIYIFYKNKELTIQDSGIGIKKEYLDKVFDRFFQWDSSRASEGLGIGLSLVQKISHIYKWKISITSIEQQGTSIKIIFS